MFLLFHSENTVKLGNQKLSQNTVSVFFDILETSGKSLVLRHVEESTENLQRRILLHCCHFKNDLQYCDDTHQIISVLQNTSSFSHSCLE